MQELINLKNNQIDNKNKKIIKKDEELEVLHRSLATKDRQFQTLVKERNRLKEELTESKKLNVRRPMIQQSKTYESSEKNVLSTPERLNKNGIFNNDRIISSSESFIEEDISDTINLTSNDLNTTPNGINNLLLSPQDIRINISTTDKIQNKDIIDLINLESGDKKEKRFYTIIKKLQNELRRERNITKQGGYIGDNVYKKPNVTLLSSPSSSKSVHSLKKSTTIVKSLFS